MDKTLAEILEASGLPSELTATLQEAFDKKVAEARETAELSIREEFARRYEHDKSNLVEAIDRMLTDTVTQYAQERVAEVAKLQETRAKFRKAVNEARAQYKRKLSEHVALTRQFALEQLSKEAGSLRAKSASLVETKAKLKADYKKLKEATAAKHASHVKKIDEFVVRQVSKELKEFAEDHRALVETRVKLVAESRSKLKETQKKFIKESAAKVEAMVNESLKREMSQLHEDLERNRQNMFGRRIFEAMAAEYMTSYFSAGTKARELQTMLESKSAELEVTKAKLTEIEQTTAANTRKVKLAEDRAARTAIMSELMSNIRGDKRAVMEGLLETVKTDNLRSAFNKLLPAVLKDDRKAAPVSGAKKLIEERQPEKRVVAVTGDQRSNRLFETVQAENEVETDSELAQVVRLAGITK